MPCPRNIVAERKRATNCALFFGAFEFQFGRLLVQLLRGFCLALSDQCMDEKIKNRRAPPFFRIIFVSDWS
jgi:hypothetical protein